MELSWALESGIQLKESWIPLKLEYRIRVPLSKAGIQYLELVSTVDKWAFIDLFLTLILCRWRKKLHIRVRQEKHRAGNGAKDHKTNKRRYLEIMIKKKKTKIIKFYPRSLYWSCNSHFSVFPQNRPILSRRSGSPQLVVQSYYVKYSELLFTVSGSHALCMNREWGSYCPSSILLHFCQCLHHAKAKYKGSVCQSVVPLYINFVHRFVDVINVSWPILFPYHLLSWSEADHKKFLLEPKSCVSEDTVWYSHGNSSGLSTFL